MAYKNLSTKQSGKHFLPVQPARWGYLVKNSAVSPARKTVKRQVSFWIYVIAGSVHNTQTAVRWLLFTSIPHKAAYPLHAWQHKELVSCHSRQSTEESAPRQSPQIPRCAFLKGTNMSSTRNTMKENDISKNRVHWCVETDFRTEEQGWHDKKLSQLTSGQQRTVCESLPKQLDGIHLKANWWRATKINIES